MFRLLQTPGGTIVTAPSGPGCALGSVSLPMVDRKRAEWRCSESGHDGGWRLRLVAVANCGAADRSIGSDSAHAAAPESLAGLPRFFSEQ